MKKDQISDEEILKRVEEWFPRAKTYWTPHHDRYTHVTKFTKAHGENAQWTEEQATARAAANPPRLTLTENLLGPFVAQVVNDIRQSDFGAEIKPRDNGTDPRLAKVRQGLHRGVQENGGWKTMIAQMADSLVTGGYAAGRMTTDFADPKSFRKELHYAGLKDPTRMFHGDGSHRKPDFCDVTDSLVYEPYSRAKFKAEFGKDPDQFLHKTDTSGVWGRGSTPWVSEYFFKLETPDELVMYGGKEWYWSELKEKLKDIAKSMQMNPRDLLETDEAGEVISRETTQCQVWWAKLAGKEVLKKEKWPGYYIPNFVAIGREVTIEGEAKFYGLAEPAMDVQRAHNYAFSAMVERAGQASKVRIFAAMESIPKSQQADWNDLATSGKMVAYYNALGKNDVPLPKPHLEQPILTDPAFADLRAMTLQGIRDVLGMWETAVGAQSNEKSGVAIQTRERQSDTGNFDWGANLAVMAEHAIRATDEVLNKVYDTPTQVRIVGDDDKEEVVWAASLEEGQENGYGYFDLNRGKFDILCRLSPSADTKREEQARGMEALFQGNPELATVMAPEYVALQDWKGADQMAKVLEGYRAVKFPGMAGGQDPQVQQMQQQLQQMQGEMQKVMQQFEALKADKQLEGQKLQIDGFRAETERIKVSAEIQHQEKELAVSAMGGGSPTPAGEPAPNPGPSRNRPRNPG